MISFQKNGWWGLIPAVIAITCGAQFRSIADTSYWTNSSGGFYSVPSNWSPNAIPAIGDDVVFTNSAVFGLTVDAGATNSTAFFQQGVITQAVAGLWLLTNGYHIGNTVSGTSRVTAISGTVAITNQAGTGLLSVGRAGMGELAIRGGSIIADGLQATNGGRSILTFGHGSLTTLHGSVISNGSKLTLGTTASNLFTWNILGGSHQIIIPPFVYGGLTLGVFGSGSGRARIHLSGPDSVLTVTGLDTYGANEIHINNGASFHTAHVQLGLNSNGSSNLVVISGGSWLNDYLMYFGMHSGGQTMVITNGGYFRTGGTMYGDQHFTTFSSGGNRIIVTGSNSWFHSDGVADIGRSWSSPQSYAHNLMLITNGGRFWARQLAFGSTNIALGSVSRPGTIVHVEDGSLWIGSLDFFVGTFRLRAGTGSIDQLNMHGGTNAVLEAQGNLLVGHHGNLNPGELRVGGDNSVLSLSGELRLGGWQLGSLPGDLGEVTLYGGGAFVTNLAQSATVLIGGAGTGRLRVDRGTVQTDLAHVASSAGSSGRLILNGSNSSFACAELIVGAGGSVTVSNGGKLQLIRCTAPASTVSVTNSTLEFISPDPLISINAIVASNATISFRNVSGASVDLNDPLYTGGIQRAGPTDLQFIQSTNASIASLFFRANDPSNWSRMVLNGGTSTLQAGNILIDMNSSLSATNTTAIIAGAVTNRGQLNVSNSVLKFVGPVALSDSFSLQGARSMILFDGGLHLSTTDLVIPPGLSIRASSITSEGGNLIISGGGLIPNQDGTVPTENIIFQDGWVTYLDTAAAPVTPPVGLSGALGLELIRSTNGPILSAQFPTGTGGYERLRLGSGSAWNSHELSIGQGGAIFVADASARITLTSGVFHLEHGGLYRDDSIGTSHVGFSSLSSNAFATVSGNGSTWSAPNGMAIGASGSQNQLLIQSGGQVLTKFTTVGGTNGDSNRLLLSGVGANYFATNGLTISGSQNEFLVQTGGVFSGSQIVGSGAGAVISLIGTGALANCSTQILLSGSQSRLQILGGANAFSSNGVLSSFLGSLGVISGEGSLWRLGGGLTINPSLSPFYPNQVVVSDKGSLVCPALSLSSSFVQGALYVLGGYVFVTNAAGGANLTVNGLFELFRGSLRSDTLTANSPYSVLNIRAGKAEWRASDFATGIPLRIGDGANLATLNLLGGTNICRSGVDVRRYSRLTGSGVIIGAVTNRGAMFPSVITIQNSLMLDSASELRFSIGGPPGDGKNSLLVVTGAVSLAGNLAIRVEPGTILSSNQNFTLIQYGSWGSNFSNVSFGQRLLTSDRLASFRVDNTGTAIVAADFQSEDLDGDGLQDSWALQHFGVSPLPAGTGTNNIDGDLDGDGLSNRNEFFLNTDPGDPSSSLLIQIEPVGPDGINVHFPFKSELSYSIRTSDDLLNWTDIPIEEVRFDANGLAVWNDRRAASIGSRLYQLVVR